MRCTSSRSAPRATPRLKCDCDPTIRSTARTPFVKPDATLSDQRLVATEVSRLFEGSTLLLHESSELLFLAGITNPLPTIYWNTAAWHYYRNDGEPMEETAARLIRSAKPDAFAYSRIIPMPRDLRRKYVPLALASPSDRYTSLIQVRREPRAGEVGDAFPRPH